MAMSIFTILYQLTSVNFHKILMTLRENSIHINQSPSNPSFLNIWPPLICFQFLWIYLFWIFQINRIIDNLPFESDCFHWALCFQGSFPCSIFHYFIPFNGWIIFPFYGYTTFVYSWIDGHLSFHLWDSC